MKMKRGNDSETRWLRGEVALYESEISACAVYGGVWKREGQQGGGAREEKRWW